MNANQPDAVAVDIPVDGDTEPKALEDNLGATWRRPDGVELASLVDADGGTQVNIIIPHSGAAREYEFEFSLPSDARSLKTANGGVLFLDAAGELLVGIAPPWALDAAGNPVPTRFEISGHKVTQIVDFTEDTTFPVVADPYLGKNLFSSIGYKYGKYYGRNTYVVTLNLSKWGWATYSGVNVPGGPAGGQAILNTLGWSEALARGGQVKKLLLSKPSMRQQFSCHALGAPGAGTWELEQFRVNRTRTWAYGVAVHHCNWTTANRY